MHALRHSLLAVVFLLVSQVSPSRAEAPADPLRLVPAQADFVVQVPQPRELIEFYINHDLAKDAYALEPVREFYESTNVRRFNQLVSYYEKQVGTRWPEVLDKVAGGGIVIASKLGKQPAPALLVAQGTDEGTVQKFVRVSVELLEAELAREESKEKLKKAKYRDHDTFHIGNDFHAAALGATILISNKEESLHKALDLSADGPAQSLAPLADIAAAKKLLPEKPMAWAWLNLAEAHKAGKDVFATPRNDANLTILFGGMLDMVGRSPYVCAALTRDKNDVALTIRMPRGHDGMPEGLNLHVPPAGQPGSLPILKPKSTLFSTSYYFDLKAVWEQRAKLFNAKQVQQFEEFDKKSGTFLLGNRFSTLSANVGPYHRVVVVNQPKAAYKKQPDQHIPAFALVMSLRNPEKFGKSMNALLRAAGFLASTQVKFTMEEIQHGKHAIVGYRFPEDEPLKGDDRNVRFNFSPAFVVVGDQFVISSTIELAKELADLLDKEEKAWGLAQDRRLAESRTAREVAVKKIEALAAELKQAGDAEAIEKLIGDLKSTAQDVQRLKKQIETLEKQEASAKPQAGSPSKEVSRVFADGIVDSLLVNEDELIAQTILNQALSPDEAKKQVGVFVSLLRRLGLVETSTTYGAKDYRIDIRLKMEKK
jgi:hypothetical protein